MDFNYELNPFAKLFVKRYCFDIEANGLLKDVSLFFCAVIEDVDTGDVTYYAPDNFQSFLDALSIAQWLIGHNIIGYDLPALNKLYNYTPNPKTLIYDTLVASRLYNPNIPMHPDCPKKVWNAHTESMKNVGPHTLRNLGFHCGSHKGDFGEDHKFDEFCPEMLDYCAQDVTVNVRLFHWLEKKLKAWSDISIQCEMDVAPHITQQMTNGWFFDIDGADKLRFNLQILKESIEEQVHVMFPPILVLLATEKKDDGSRGPKITQPRIKADGGVSSVGLKAFYGDQWEDLFYPPEHRIFPGHIQYTSGSFTKLQTEVFNLGSRPQIASRFQRVGVKLTKKTPKGNLIIDDEVLNELAKKYPEIPEIHLIQRHFKVSKILSMVENWISAYDWDTGCIHGYVNSVGAVTNRMTHSNPNVTQTPSANKASIDGTIDPNTLKVVSYKKADFLNLICSESSWDHIEGTVVKFDTKHNKIVSKVFTHAAFQQTPEIIAEAGFSLLWGEEGDWGADCRNLFTVGEGRALVGCDASGLELRCLAHYMDDDKYTDLILNGDIHTYNQKLAGLPTRDDSKTFIYAFLYGAGDAKIGSIVGGNGVIGKRLKGKFLKGLPKLKRLIEGVTDKAESTGASGVSSLKGLDGRRIRVRNTYAALNSLLQSCGSIVCKLWLLAIMEESERLHLDIKLSGSIHDEYQFSVKNQDVITFKEVCEYTMPAVGEYLNFRCPLAAEANHGVSWAHTH